MTETLVTIWTWCPKCTVRTYHVKINGVFRCLACGYLHLTIK
jgi:hypothetical protein